MDFSSVLETLQDAKESVTDFIQENAKVTVAIVGILLFLSVSALLLAISRDEGGKQQEAVVLPQIQPYHAADDFFPPQKESLTENYYFSRDEGFEWSDEEFDRWFTLPTQERVDDLGKANHKAADEILGAAP